MIQTSMAKVRRLSLPNNSPQGLALGTWIVLNLMP